MHLGTFLIQLNFLVYSCISEGLHFGNSQFICENNILTEIKGGDRAIISLPPNGVYNFRVNFKNLADKQCTNQQRCNLLIWKAVRDLGKFLNKNCCQNGQVELNKTMLMSGIEYIIDATVQTRDETLIKHYTLNIDEQIMSNKPLASVHILLGTSVASVYNSFVVNAEESICSNQVSDYYFQWQILDESNVLVIDFQDKNKELTIQPSSLQNLQPGIKYKIVCMLVNMANGVSIAMDSKDIEVRNEGTNVDSNSVDIPGAIESIMTTSTTTPTTTATKTTTITTVPSTPIENIEPVAIPSDSSTVSATNAATNSADIPAATESNVTTSTTTPKTTTATQTTTITTVPSTPTENFEPVPESYDTVTIVSDPSTVSENSAVTESVAVHSVPTTSVENIKPASGNDDTATTVSDLTTASENSAATESVTINSFPSTSVENIEPASDGEGTATVASNLNTEPENSAPTTEITSGASSPESSSSTEPIDVGIDSNNSEGATDEIVVTTEVTDENNKVPTDSVDATNDSTESNSRSTVIEQMDNQETTVINVESDTIGQDASTVVDSTTNVINNNEETSIENTVTESASESTTLITEQELVDSSGVANRYYSQKFSVFFPFQYTTIAVNYPIHVKPMVFSYLGSEDDLDMEWTCIHLGTDICKGMKDTELNIETGLPKEGNLSIILKVSNKMKSELASCTIILIADLPSIEIEISDYPVKPYEGVRVIAVVSELRTYCTIHWRSEGENAFNLSLLPGNVDQLYNITAPEDQFLSELEEFGDEVINKEFVLEFPPTSEHGAGLTDEFYQFTLIVRCPSLAEVVNSANELTEKPDDFVVVKAAILLEVTLPPTPKKLEIAPTEGEALKTVFKFNTASASGQPPILYKFGYVLHKREIVSYSLMEMTSATSMLPYSKDGIRIFLMVCDYVNSCAKTYGPTVKLTSPTELDLNQIQRNFKQKINSEEYSKAFGYAYSVLESSKPLQKEKEFMKMCSEIVSQKIKSLVDTDTKDRHWRTNSNNLIKSISDFDVDLNLSKEVINDLILLRQELTSETNNIRKLLSIDGKPANLDELKYLLDISEIVITNNNTDEEQIRKEKDHIINTLRIYMPKLCVALYNKATRIRGELKTVLFSVEKLNKKLGNYLTIPFDMNRWNATAKIKINVGSSITDNKFCVGKTVFKEYFNKKGLQFGAVLLNGDDVKDGEYNFGATVLLPIVENSDLIAKCAVYNEGSENECKFQKKISNFAQFSCPNLGHFFLGYENPNTKTESDQNNITIIPNINKTNTSSVIIVPAKVHSTYATISYVVIISSLIGLVILGYIIKKISMGPRYNVHTVDMENAQYANLYNEEMLT